MRIFENLADKVNFVDEHNVVLGYDLGQCCCEHATWFIAESVRDDLLSEMDENHKWVMQFDWDYWLFDKTFFEEKGDCDNGAIAIFRIYKDDKEYFIHLYNCHNGYYGHGFDFMVGKKKIQDGCL